MRTYQLVIKSKISFGSKIWAVFAVWNDGLINQLTGLYYNYSAAKYARTVIIQRKEWWERYHIVYNNHLMFKKQYKNQYDTMIKEYGF